MSVDTPENVVFDCTIFAQALISARGPAAACLSFAQERKLILFVSDYVLQEILELPSKIRPQFGVTTDKVRRLVNDLAKYATSAKLVPHVYNNPFDSDDSHYIDLAAATKSKLIVSRDRHLLNLMDAKRTEAKE